MSHNYDNWERLVAAVLKRELLWELFHADSRSPSDLSEASLDFSSSSSFKDVSFGQMIHVGSSYNMQQAPQQATVDKSNKNQGGLVFITDYEPVFELEDLLRASSEILGKGNFGRAYSAKLENGATVAVKRLKTVTRISEKDFKKHMTMVGKIKHENVAALRAYYSDYSSTIEMFVVHDYYSHGSVSALLHGEPREIRSTVNWNVRLGIAIGAATGIYHIHKQKVGKMVHGNIKSSNVFLNSQGCGVVSDLGLANMIVTVLPRSTWYYAPEVNSTQDITQASDVYSFGVLLIELLTRRSPDLSVGHDEAVHLAKLVNSVSREEWNTKVFDGDLLLDPSIRDQIVRMLEIGISCVAESPRKRPKMSSVVTKIKDISMINSLQTKRNTLVFLGFGYPTFGLKEVLKASAEVLGDRTLGKSYRVVLENGVTVCVKRFKGVIATENEFRQHVKIIGRVRHKNVADIKAYFYSRDENLLVYDYYNQGNLSSTLHGNIHSAKRHLDWNTRLKIVKSVAKGIAHIHTRNGHMLVHGNISASNILLDEQLYGIVTDVGMEKLVSPTTLSVTRNNAGYCAPEMAINRQASLQASDVYSFGVVLLELLSGLPPLTTYKGEAMSLVNRTLSIVQEKWASQVFDAELSRYIDAEEEMVEMMQIAMCCVDIVAHKRPKMDDVVRMLEEIAGP